MGGCGLALVAVHPGGTRTDVAGYLASTLFPEARRERRAAVALSLAFQRAAGRIPGLRRLGANYTILARPSA